MQDQPIACGRLPGGHRGRDLSGVDHPLGRPPIRWPDNGARGRLSFAATASAGNHDKPKDGQDTAKCENNYAVALAKLQSAKDDAEHPADATDNDRYRHRPKGTPTCCGQ